MGAVGAAMRSARQGDQKGPVGGTYGLGGDRPVRQPKRRNMMNNGYPNGMDPEMQYYADSNYAPSEAVSNMSHHQQKHQMQMQMEYNNEMNNINNNNNNLNPNMPMFGQNDSNRMDLYNGPSVGSSDIGGGGAGGAGMGGSGAVGIAAGGSQYAGTEYGAASEYAASEYKDGTMETTGDDEIAPAAATQSNYGDASNYAPSQFDGSQYGPEMQQYPPQQYQQQQPYPYQTGPQGAQGSQYAPSVAPSDVPSHYDPNNPYNPYHNGPIAAAAAQYNQNDPSSNSRNLYQQKYGNLHLKRTHTGASQQSHRSGAGSVAGSQRSGIAPYGQKTFKISKKRTQPAMSSGPQI